MELAKKDGLKDIEIRVMRADFGKKYDVYGEKNQQVAVDAFNKTFNTKYKLSDIKNISLDIGDNIARDSRLSGTPSFIFNGKLKDARRKIVEALSK
jgi:hypothetical protein